jgi:hypothetical protein
VFSYFTATSRAKRCIGWTINFKLGHFANKYKKCIDPYRNEGQPWSLDNPVKLGVVVAEPTGRVQVVARYQGPGQSHQDRQTPTNGVVQPIKW